MLHLKAATRFDTPRSSQIQLHGRVGTFDAFKNKFSQKDTSLK